MRTKLLGSVPLLLCVGALFSPLSLAADKFDVMAMEYFDPYNILGGGVVGYFDPDPPAPAIHCPGHEPTGDPMQPCPVGSRTHIRDLVWVSRVESPDPNMSGWMTVVMNANMDTNHEGPVWGTFSIALDSGGAWEGTWHTLREAEGDHWVATLKVQGKGIGGAVDGMKMMAEDEITSFTAFNLAYYGSIYGRVIDPS